MKQRVKIAKTPNFDSPTVDFAKAKGKVRKISRKRHTRLSLFMNVGSRTSYARKYIRNSA